MKMIALSAVLFAGIALTPAMAQEPGSRATRDFVEAAGQSDAFEIMEARTAIAESHDPHVLGFAKEMIRDHGTTRQTLLNATARAGLRPPPMGLGAGQAPFLATLQSLRGVDFDQAYWRQQVLAHRSALTTEEQYARTGDAPAVRSAAASGLPIIRSHLAMAERMVAKPISGF